MENTVIGKPQSRPRKANNPVEYNSDGGVTISKKAKSIIKTFSFHGALYAGYYNNSVSDVQVTHIPC